MTVSPLTPRWCQQPLQGRFNQVFCKAACRSKAARHGIVGGPPIDWSARTAQAEQRVAELQTQVAQQAQDRQVAAPLECRYDEFTQVPNVLVLELPSPGPLPSLLQ
jgi:hypothetical protein